MATINQKLPFGKLEYVQRWVEAHELYFDYFTHHARAMALVEGEENNLPQYFPQCTNQAKDIGNVEEHTKNIAQGASELTLASYDEFLKKYSPHSS